MYKPADTRNPWLPPELGGKNMGSYAKSNFVIPGQSGPQGNALMVSPPPCGCSSQGLGAMSGSSWLLIGGAAIAAWWFFFKR